METDAGYVSELLAEKDSLDPSFVNCMRLLTRGECMHSITSSLHGGYLIY